MNHSDASATVIMNHMSASTFLVVGSIIIDPHPYLWRRLMFIRGALAAGIARRDICVERDQLPANKTWASLSALGPAEVDALHSCLNFLVRPFSMVLSASTLDSWVSTLVTGVHFLA